MCPGGPDGPTVAKFEFSHKAFMTYYDELRAITLEGMFLYGSLLNLKKTLVPNNVTKFHKIQIQIIRLREWTPLV